ncbi:hypothetical protein ILYODFUR_036284 [Ilyodon furcidens]|uniref:Uncharacterized protein n=1 Tax=Ilyodon furcidens TaxID=33524 RepID=A0ABV0TGJ0_9TELE
MGSKFLTRSQQIHLVFLVLLKFTFRSLETPRHLKVKGPVHIQNYEAEHTESHSVRCVPESVWLDHCQDLWVGGSEEEEDSRRSDVSSEHSYWECCLILWTTFRGG